MFDRDENYYLLGSVTPVQHTHTVHEYRAPTDESVKLLAEMEEKIRQRVESSFRLQDNNFEFLVQGHSMMESAQFYICMYFTLNGNRIRAEHYYKELDSFEELPGKLRDALAKEIATHVLTQSEKKLEEALSPLFLKQRFPFRPQDRR